MLYVTGASVLDIGVTAGSLNVTGQSVLHGTVTTGALNVTGESILQGGITAGMLYVTGASVFNNGITGGSLNITGNSTLHGFVTTGALCVTGATLLQSNLTATNGSVFFGTTDTSPIIGGTSATGGAIIFNTVDVSPSMGDIVRERIFYAANNVSVPANITGFTFNNAVVRSFDAICSITIKSTGGTNDKYALYNLMGVQKGATWVLNSSYVGDVTGITFSISNSGQVQYTSTNSASYLESTINFRALTTSLPL
jgi:cytoskeletal protein CcmA (bactofilin family)